MLKMIRGRTRKKDVPVDSASVIGGDNDDGDHSTVLMSEPIKMCSCVSLYE